MTIASYACCAAASFVAAIPRPVATAPSAAPLTKFLRVKEEFESPLVIACSQYGFVPGRANVGRIDRRTSPTPAIAGLRQSIDEGLFGRSEEKIQTESGAVYDNDGVRLPAASAGVMVQIETEAVARGNINDLRRYPMTHGHSPLDRSVALLATRSTDYLCGNRVPVAFSSIIEPCRRSACRITVT